MRIEEQGGALFYRLTEAASDVAEKPLVIWLNGVQTIRNAIVGSTLIITSLGSASPPSYEGLPAVPAPRLCPDLVLAFHSSVLAAPAFPDSISAFGSWLQHSDASGLPRPWLSSFDFVPAVPVVLTPSRPRSAPGSIIRTPSAFHNPGSRLSTPSRRSRPSRLCPGLVRLPAPSSGHLLPSTALSRLPLAFHGSVRAAPAFPGSVPAFHGSVPASSSLEHPGPAPGAAPLSDFSPEIGNCTSLATLGLAETGFFGLLPPTLG